MSQLWCQILINIFKYNKYNNIHYAIELKIIAIDNYKIEITSTFNYNIVIKKNHFPQ